MIKQMSIAAPTGHFFLTPLLYTSIMLDVRTGKTLKFMEMNPRLREQCQSLETIIEQGAPARASQWLKKTSIQNTHVPCDSVSH